MAPIAIRLKGVVLLFLIDCLLLPSSFVGLCVWPLFCCVVLSVLSSFAIISLRKRELVALPSLCSCYHVAAGFLCHFLTVPCVGLKCVIFGISWPCLLAFRSQRLCLKMIKICLTARKLNSIFICNGGCTYV